MSEAPDQYRKLGKKYEKQGIKLLERRCHNCGTPTGCVACESFWGIDIGMLVECPLKCGWTSEVWRETQ